jgi:hypothetical protein
MLYLLTFAFRTPSSLAWQMIFAKSQPSHVIEHFRQAFSDGGNTVENYRFSHLHEYVLDRRQGDLHEVIISDPDCLNRTDKDGNTPLIWASRRGDLDKVKILLEHGASIDILNEAREDVFSVAAMDGRPEVVIALLEAGASIRPDADGKTALHHVCNKYEFPIIVKLLIERGADVNAYDHLHRSPLALAAFRNHHATVACLLEHQADIEALDSFGSTPVLRAVRYGAVEVTDTLLRHSASHLGIDKKGMTLLHRAALTLSIELFNVLKSYKLPDIPIEHRDIAGKTAHECLLESKPSLDTIHAFRSLLESIRKATERVDNALLAEAISRPSTPEIFFDALET